MSTLRSRVLMHLRRPMIAALHAVLIAQAWVGSFALRLDFTIDEPFRSAMLSTLPLVIVVKLAIFFAFRLFQGWWKYAGFNDLLDIAKATTLATITVIVSTYAMRGLTDFPRAVFLVDFVLTFLFVGGVRFVFRAYMESFRFWMVSSPQKRVLVVGAGRTGLTLLREMRADRAMRYAPVGFVDDDPTKQNIRVDGLKVHGTTEDIPTLLKQLEVDEVLLAIPATSGQDIRRIITACQDSRAVVKTMPSVGELLDGTISVNRIREVRIDDLLGRDAIQTNLERVRGNNEGHVVLVTGAAGSIGSELSRQIAMLAPANLVLFERSESDLHDLALALQHVLPNLPLTTVVGDILDQGDVEAVFERYHPSRVYHAAAYKHVGLMERHVVGAIRNNVIGTCNVAMAAHRFGVEQFVLISTDKAVKPTSLMGATKRAAERILVSLGRNSATRFCIVRFGNVLGSRGSVVPIFKRQIELGGPVTVTHPDVVRYFMTIPEAAQLVLQASASSEGGDIFHLDMGEPVRIAELAANMIRLSGFEPGRDIEIKFVGLRPGEKLYEELLVEGDDVVPTEHPRVRVVRTVDSGLDNRWIDAVRRGVDRRDVAGLMALIQDAVPEFTPSELVATSSRLTMVSGAGDRPA